MKHTTNFFTFLVLFIASIMFLTLPVSAIIYEDLIDNSTGLGYYSPNTMLEIESTRGWITVFNPSGAGSLDVKIYDLPNPEDAVIGLDGLIYFVLEDGRVFQCTNSNYKSFESDYNTSFILLGDVDGLSISRDIVIDEDNNVYVNSDDSVYKFSYPSLSMSIYVDDVYGAAGAASSIIECLAVHSSGILAGMSELSNTATVPTVWLLTDSGKTEIYLSTSGASGQPEYDFRAMYATTTGDIYVERSTDLILLDYSDSYAVSTVSSLPSTATGMNIDEDGIIYISFSDNTIITYSTTDLAGGYSGGIVGDIEGSYINWDSSYVLGDTGSYTWGWDADDKSLLRSEKVKIHRDGVLLDTITVGDTGTRYYDLNEVGSYQVSLVTTFPFTSDQVYASDYVEVNEVADSWINVPQTAPIKENFSVSYMYGITPTSPIINIKELQNDYTYKIIDTYILSSVLGGTTYTTNLSVSSVGYYVIDLYDNGHGKSFATDTIQTNFVYIPPSDVVLSSYINTTQNVYAFGGVISGSYAIEDNNFTDYHTRIEVYSVDNDIISFAYEPLHQIDGFDIPISDFNVYSDGDTSYHVNTNFLSGDNRVQLSAYNADGTLNEVIAHKNITISVTDGEGYGLSLSKYTVEENEIFAIKAITPVQASIVIHPLTLMGVSDTTILINGTTQMSYALGIEDTYSISLVSSGETKATQIIKVLEGEEITAPVEEEEGVAFDTKFDSMLSSGAFVALLIIIACVGAFGKIGGVVGVFLGMVVGISISFLMGYLPAWILFIMVLALCVVFVSKLINSFGGGE